MASNTASLLPLIPRVFFVYLEPVLISVGMFMSYAQTSNIFKLSSLHGPLPIPALIIPYETSGYLLCMMFYGLSILLASPPNKRLLQLHIGILMFADLFHWLCVFSTIAQTDPRGWAAIFDTTSWDSELWNQMTYPITTLIVKIATLTGVFGEIKG